MQNSKMHLRHSLLFQFNLGLNASEAARNICTAYGSDAMSRNTAWFWFDRFRNGNILLQDQPKSGRPTTIDLDELKQAIESDPTLSTSNVANKLNCTGSLSFYETPLSFKVRR